MEEMKAQMANNDKELEEMKLSYEERLKAAQAGQGFGIGFGAIGETET